jgi:sec-independent protein translocase protein TatC
MNDSVNPNQAEAIHFLIELRARLIRSLIVLMVIFSAFLYFANHLYTFLALPLLKFLPQGHLIATQIVSPFFVPFKLAFMAAMFISAPYFLFQIWGFIAPALYGHERQQIWPYLLMSTFLFYLGIVFAYFVIFPMLFHFLAKIAPEGVMLAPDISEYLDFAIKLLMVFGGLFEIPIIMLMLVATKLVTQAKLVSLRSYAIVGAFILGMLLAPPDVVSQTILAIPIWLLYEVGLVMSKFAIKTDALKQADKN